MSRGESIRNRFAATSVAAVAAIIAFAQSYGRWLDPIIDAGRDLYVPEQLLRGTVLYRDILYYYPPLTPYLLAAITFITGSSLGAYVAIGLVTSLLTATAIWWIVRPLAGELAAGAALLIFFAFSMAGIGGWGCNYFFPYAHAATFAMLFFLWSIALLLRGHATAATLLLVAASWTKIEYALFALALVVLFRGKKLVYAMAMLTTLVVALAIFGADALRANVLPPSLLGGTSARFFYAQVTGMHDWPANLLLSLRGAAMIVLVVLLLAAWERRPQLRVAIVVAVALAIALLANDTFFRAWTLLQLALIPFALRRPREPLALLLFASLCASSRIWLNVTPAWYGFVFVIPVVVLIVYVLFAWLPERGVYSRRASLAWAPLFVLLAASGLYAAHVSYRDAVPVTTPRGVYYDRSPERAAAMRALLPRLRGRELVVMPEGLAINYLAKAHTPLRYQTFTPVEIIGEERAIVAELNARQPRSVLLVPRDTREFGYRGFGIDYGREIASWLRARYVVEARFGAMVLLSSRPETPRPRSPSARTPAPTPR
ncbi:MAG TPA: hypothetical protein VJZ00_08570 [Thermoanaerobaculia bacterium]|nr:hypothetical protein [Thermoanaerobaculia bacterium]